jgi:hypothetical protein
MGRFRAPAERRRHFIRPGTKTLHPPPLLRRAASRIGEGPPRQRTPAFGGNTSYGTSRAHPLCRPCREAIRRIAEEADAHLAQVIQAAL